MTFDFVCRMGTLARPAEVGQECPTYDFICPKLPSPSTLLLQLQTGTAPLPLFNQLAYFLYRLGQHFVLGLIDVDADQARFTSRILQIRKLAFQK